MFLANATVFGQAWSGSHQPSESRPCDEGSKVMENAAAIMMDNQHLRIFATYSFVYVYGYDMVMIWLSMATAVE